jgi:hypothetical protein
VPHMTDGSQIVPFVQGPQHGVDLSGLSEADADSVAIIAEQLPQIPVDAIRATLESFNVGGSIRQSSHQLASPALDCARLMLMQLYTCRVI